MSGGVGVSTNHKSSNRFELSWFSQHFFNFSVLTWSHPSTHPTTQPPTHPPNHTPTHGWGILYRFQIFKRNWNILISSSVIKFLLILGVHLPREWRMGGWGWGWVWVCGGGVPCTYTCTCMRACVHACACMHMHACMHVLTHMHVKHANHAKHGCNFYTCIHVHMCVCLHVHVCACVGGHPPCSQTPPTHLPHPPELRKPKSEELQ